MIAADAGAVDAAVVARLSGDALLAALLPDGVHWGVAPRGATRFVIVSHVLHDDAYALGYGVAYERFIYLCKAVTAGTTGALAAQAEARIHRLMQDTPITAAGYHPSTAVQRVDRLRPDPEIDEATDERWQHRGGQYEILITPLPE